ncbi:MAG: transglycosylase SLT domain-containing protein [Nanoarchaeota archaeon]|nr:transglycosylase SLT domain-containing protein [DPANN group archaeon]MBL7116840.1 transglycosylase SLT domain-containing protein [Nanoarchaeota archaeon]
MEGWLLEVNRDGSTELVYYPTRQKRVFRKKLKKSLRKLDVRYRTSWKNKVDKILDPLMLAGIEAAIIYKSLEYLIKNFQELSTKEAVLIGLGSSVAATATYHFRNEFKKLHKRAKERIEDNETPSRKSYWNYLGIPAIAALFSLNFTEAPEITSADIENTYKETKPRLENIVKDVKPTTIEQTKHAETDKTITKKSLLEIDIERNVEILLKPAIRVNIERHFSNISQYDDYLNKATLTGLTKNYLMSVFGSESNGDLRAKSKAGAEGIAQFTYSTARERGITINNVVDYRYHPSSIIEGAKYLAALKREFGSELLATIAYNWGAGRTHKLIERYGTKWENIKWHIPQETRDYVVRIFSRKQILDNAEKYNFAYEEKPLFTERIKKAHKHKVARGEHILKIKRKYRVSFKDIQELNPEIRDYNKILPRQKINIPRT